MGNETMIDMSCWGLVILLQQFTFVLVGFHKYANMLD
jgi:hypothetical protein